jgi:hypothetical protein
LPLEFGATDIVEERKDDGVPRVTDLGEAAEGYRAMDERRAIKTLLRV